MNDSDQAETRVNEIDVCSSFSKGSMLDEEQSQNCTNGSLNNTEHAHGSVIDKQCDDNTVKDISVDEGVLEKHQCFQSTQANSSGVLLEVPSTSVECQVDVDNLFDFDSLLDLAETGNNQTQEIPDHTSDKSYLDELLATSNNPFLEDSPLERCLGAEKEAANAVHPSNPFNIDVTLSEYEGNNSTGPDEASNKFYTQSDVIEGVISSKNPFLDTSSFKLAMDDFKQAEKTSGNGVTVDGAVIKEMTTHADEKETTSNGKDEAPSITSQVSSQGASEKMKVPEQCNSPPANGSQLQHEPLESSFASINPYPALVSYSGQIPFSGSMSRRSESSATSNRSFAFPVLQTELKASPVRMAKADRKHNSWKALLCSTREPFHLHRSLYKLINRKCRNQTLCAPKDRSVVLEMTLVKSSKLLCFVGVSFLLLVGCDCLQVRPASLRFHIHQGKDKDQYKEVRVSVLKLLPRKKLHVLARKVTVTVRESSEKVPPSKSYTPDKKIHPDKLERKKASAAVAKAHVGRGRTWQEWMDNGGGVFTMDYSRVRRRRPIHNKGLPVGP